MFGVKQPKKIKGEKVCPGAIARAERAPLIIFNEQKTQGRTLHCDTFLANNYQKYVLIGEF